YNMGPTTIGDWIRQRRRNYAGHLHLRRKYGYRVSSLDNAKVIRIALEELAGALRIILYLFWVGSMEFLSRMLGAYDYYIRKEKHVVWDMAWTTKEVDVAGVDKPGQSKRGGP
ncbi:MAG: hypothetical protein HY783_07720, partial [Chloroflexi bacterium]|nr:hypothetical protein [Chloroflexota bacterium]